MAGCSDLVEQSSQPQTTDGSSNGVIIDESVAQLNLAMQLLSEVAERMGHHAPAVAKPAAKEGMSGSAKISSQRRKRPKADQPKDTQMPVEPNPASAIEGRNIPAADFVHESGIRGVQVNAPSTEVFYRFFTEALRLYETMRQREAEERDARFSSKDRAVVMREVQATIHAVLSSPLISGAEKNQLLRSLIQQVVPYEDRVEITYW